MSCFGSATIDKNGLGARLSPDFPLVRKLAIHGFAPQSGRHTKPHPHACRLSNISAVERGDLSYESNHLAWLSQAKNLSGRFLSRRYPAARDLCGNGLMHKHVAKTGGVYE
jgi:hypothetical protein